MKKQELQRTALKLFNQGICNSGDMIFSPEMVSASKKEIKICSGYMSELFVIGKTSFKKKYLIK